MIATIGDPVTFSPHLHFEVKNRTALVNPPFASCSNTPNGIYVSAGYSGKRNDYAGGDAWDPTDGVTGNLYFHPTRLIQQRLPPGAGLLGDEGDEGTRGVPEAQTDGDRVRESSHRVERRLR